MPETTGCQAEITNCAAFATGTHSARIKRHRRRRKIMPEGQQLVGDDVILGEGAFRYRVNRDWAKLPDGWSFHEVAAVGVDSNDNVFVFNRGAHPMTVFDRNGNFLRAWGEDIFSHAHGIQMAPDGTIYCTDDGDHTVRQLTPEGKVLMQLGVPGQASPFMSGLPFNRCTHTALSPSGDLYVSDGYGNARVHKYSPDGKLLLSWGTSRQRSGRVQSAAQHRLRSRGLGLCRRPREPSHPGVRRQRQIRNAVEQFAQAQWTMHDIWEVPVVLCGGNRAVHVGQSPVSQHRSAGQHSRRHRQRSRPPRPHRGCRRPGTGPVHVAARHRGRILTEIFMSGRWWSVRGPRRFRTSPGRRI